MSAGTGVRHSEYNHADGKTHLLQIWIEPSARGIAPSYEQKRFTDADKRGRLALVVAPPAEAAAAGAVTMHADARLYAGLFDGDESAQMVLDPARKAYVHLVRGSLDVNGQPLSGGDALLVDGESALTLRQGRDAEVLVFDLAA